MPQNAGVVSGDLRDFEQGRLDLTGFDTVVHLAAVLTGHDVVPVNVDGARALAGAARTAGVSRFIHCSSAGVYGDSEDPAPLVETDRTSPATPYERSKRDGEQAVI